MREKRKGRKEKRKKNEKGSKSSALGPQTSSYDFNDVISMTLMTLRFGQSYIRTGYRRISVNCSKLIHCFLIHFACRCNVLVVSPRGDEMLCSLYSRFASRSFSSRQIKLMWRDGRTSCAPTDRSRKTPSRRNQ